jgi:hypothetical protein
MSVLLSEYEEGPINSRVFKLADGSYQVLVFNATTGKEMAEFFKHYQQACTFAEDQVLLNE